jgi:hypothetical protein
LNRFISQPRSNLIGPATMLIDHDFDWEVDREKSPRPDVLAPAAVVPGHITTPGRPVGHLRPSDGVVIIETVRGFSPGTLAVAVVALVLSATLRLSDSRHPELEPIIDRTAVSPGFRTQVQVSPVGRPGIESLNGSMNGSVR